jgi:hypothetical protein
MAPENNDYNIFIGKKTWLPKPMGGTTGTPIKDPTDLVLSRTTGYVKKSPALPQITVNSSGVCEYTLGGTTYTSNILYNKECRLNGLKADTFTIFSPVLSFSQDADLNIIKSLLTSPWSNSKYKLLTKGIYDLNLYSRNQNGTILIEASDPLHNA